MQTISLKQNFSPNLDVLRQIGDLSSEAVIIYSSLEQKLVYSNTAASNLLGLHENSSSADIKRLMTRIVEDDQQYMISQYSAVTRESVTSEVEFTFKNLDHSEITLRCKGYQLSDDSTIIVFLNDITKPKDHENYLVEFGARKNTVLDIVAHHISSALTLMQHLSKEAQKYIRDDGDENLKIYFDLLHDNSKTCLEIITDLMIAEHGRSPEIGPKNGRLNIVNKISIVHDELRKSYKTREFVFRHSGRPMFARADEIKLLQVVNNLVTNAVKFSPVTDPVTISILDNAEEVIVRVEDHGIGIPEQLKPLMFERQIGTGRRGLKGEKSVGLGLSVCKNLVQIMNGRIWFESEEGKGSSFYFSLPKA